MVDIITFIKKYYGFILFILVVVLSVFLFQTRTTLKKERDDNAFQQKINEQNISAITDSITVVFNKKLKVWEYSKDNFVVQKLSDLEKYNKVLAEELKKVKGDIISVIDANVQARLDNLSVDSKLKVLDEKTNHYGLEFDSQYKDLGYDQHIAGISKFFVFPNMLSGKWTITPDSTKFTTNLTNIHITYGFKELDKKYQVWAYTKSDKVQITDITGGYFIDKQIFPPVKKKKWGIGPSVGYGLNLNSTPSFGGSIGFGIHYDILQW